MKRRALTCLMVVLAGCVSAPVKAPVAPIADPNKTVLAAIGILECGKMKGIVVVTKAGEVVPVQDESPEDLAQLAKGLPDDAAGVLDLTDNCAPTQSTKF